MWTHIRVWIKDHSTKMVNSIAFYPAIIAVVFLVLSVLSISFDFSEKGMQLTFEQIFEDTIMPIWDYGKKDRLVQKELHHLLAGLLTIAPDTKIVRTLLQEVKQQMKDSSH